MDTLRQIKLLRKLGVPLEEIRRMQAGRITVADGMRRHLVTLEPVSYTHLDVYKRQPPLSVSMICWHTE